MGKRKHANEVQSVSSAQEKATTPAATKRKSGSSSRSSSTNVSKRTNPPDVDGDELLTRKQSLSSQASTEQLSKPDHSPTETDASDSDDELTVRIIERPASAVPPSRNGASVHSASDSDEDSSEGEVGLSINAKYAAQFEAEKRQQELSKKAQRGKKKSDMIALVQQEMGGMEEDDEDEEAEDGDEEEEEEDEDDEGALLTEELDVRIHETLNAIKRKDPRVYDKATVFFADEEVGASSKAGTSNGDRKKVTVKELLLQSMNGEDDEQESGGGDSSKPLTHVQEQAKLKRELLKAANSDSKMKEEDGEAEDGSDEDDDDDLFKVRINSATSDSSSSDATSSAPLSSSAFLTSYLSHQWWKADPSTLPDWTAIRGEQPNPSLPSLSDEESEEEREEQFEAAYNFRHQEAGGGEVKTWPRVVEDSVRRKDNTRKAARERKREAQEAERVRQREELKRIKNDKLRGLAEKVRQVEEVSGVELDDEARSGMRLDGGWDEAEHERLMARLFDTEYYDKDAANEDEEAAIERIRREEEEEEEKAGTKAAGGRGRLLSTVHPKVRQELLAGMDELYALDYEDVIGGGAIKTRFHYTRVKPDTYGLSLEDILDREDKELNRHVSIKKLAPYRAENEPVEEEAEGGKEGKGGRGGKGKGGYHERRVEGVKRKLDAKKKAQKKQQQSEGSGDAQTSETGQQAKAEGAEAVKQKPAKGGGAPTPAVVRADGKLSATQKRRLREKNAKARLSDFGAAANDSAPATKSAISEQQPSKRHKAEK